MKMSILLVSLVSLFCSGIALAGSETWGGKNIQIDVTGTTAQISFDCAEGNVPRGWKANSKGRIDVRGTTTAYSGGPVRQDSPKPKPVATRYTAKIVGNIMNLTITEKSGKAKFTLVKGAPGELYRCM
jgi:hypothetical protein